MDFGIATSSAGVRPGRRDDRHHRLHGARTGHRQAGGRARRHLRLRPDPLRHAARAAAGQRGRAGRSTSCGAASSPRRRPRARSGPTFRSRSMPWCQTASSRRPNSASPTRCPRAGLEPSPTTASSDPWRCRARWPAMAAAPALPPCWPRSCGGVSPPPVVVERAPVSVLIADFENQDRRPGLQRRPRTGARSRHRKRLVHHRLSAPRCAARRRRGPPGRPLDEQTARLVALSEGVAGLLPVSRIAAENRGYRINIRRCAGATSRLRGAR